MKDILARAADWTGQTWAGRIDQCASMLFCHGYIPLSVRDKITRRLTKECETAIAMEARRADDAEGGSAGTATARAEGIAQTTPSTAPVGSRPNQGPGRGNTSRSDDER